MDEVWVKSVEDLHRREAQRKRAAAWNWYGKFPTIGDVAFSEIVHAVHSHELQTDCLTRGPYGPTYDEALEYLTGNRVTREDWLNGDIAEVLKCKDEQIPAFIRLCVKVELKPCWRSMHHNFYWRRELRHLVAKAVRGLASVQEVRRAKESSQELFRVVAAAHARQTEEKWRLRRLRRQEIRELRQALMEFRGQLRSSKHSEALLAP